MPPRQEIVKIPSARKRGETVKRVLLLLGFYLSFVGLGALLFAIQAPIGWTVQGEPLPTAPAVVTETWVSPLWLNALVGALGGLLVAAGVRGVTQAVMRAVRAGEGIALLNASLTGLIGALFGLLGYAVLELLFGTGQPNVWLQLAQAGLLFFLTYLGFRIGYSRENLLLAFITGSGFETMASSEGAERTPKVIDTSVIIDGRISDLVKTGFLEGPIYIPEFVLEELHGIADSSDSLRRRKGRRGLDILAEIRNSPKVEVEIVDRDFPDVHDVDHKLIRLAKALNAKIITTDFNLNKVAKVSGVEVLNINELANALKPRFIPGEELEVEVIDRGQEIGQGVGYLDDGTMVVVENGRRYIGKKVRAVVSSSLQTDAGKMLFVRAKGEVDGQYQQSEVGGK